MKAFTLEKYGAPLRETVLSDPSPQPQEVVVRMIAAGVNHADERTRTGEFKAIFSLDLPTILGGELCGEIIAVGSQVRDLRVGELVHGYLGVLPTGAFAEVVAVDAASLAPVPSSLTPVEAAALPVAGLSAWQALVGIADLQPGQTVLIHGGAGGVGAASIQLAHHLGATVATTVSGSSAEQVRGLGADIVIDYRTEDFVQRLAGTPVHAVLDTQGGEVLARSLEVLSPGGTVVGITGPPDPAFAVQAGVNPVVRQVLRLISARTRSRARKLGVTYRFLFIEPDGAQLRRIDELVDRGLMRPVIDRVLPFEQTPEALAQVIRGGTRGKVVVTTDPGAVTQAS